MQADRTLVAAGLVMIFAAIIGLIDNFVRLVAAEGGLWQFHAIRTAMILAMVGLVAVPFRLRLWPKRPGRVLARSAVHGASMVIYFGALGFLPVAQVGAGLFTAPIFVLLISRFAYGIAIGPVRVAAVVLGFAGVVMVLGPEALRGASLAALLPVFAGFLYALSAVATREWCAGETAQTLAVAMFTTMGAIGLVGLGVVTWLAPEVPEGTAGFVLRGWVTPTPAFLGWTFVQALGSLIGVTALVRAYQIAQASRVSVFEYLTLPMAALWGWMLWGEVLTPLAFFGMALITAAGAMIALNARQDAVSPTA